MAFFEHTSSEKGMWRGWLKSGDSLEITWPRTSVGLKFSLKSWDGVGSRRQLWIGLGFIQAFVPMGWSREEFPVFEGPGWGFDFSREFGIAFEWGYCRKSFDWPFSRVMLAYEYLGVDGAWHEVMAVWRDQDAVPTAIEQAPYVYHLRSGDAQHRIATISTRRHIISRKILHKIGWPKQDKRSIDVEFDGEVGERSGSWKGGCIGCSYDMQPGEGPIDTLRRMEAERKFR